MSVIIENQHGKINFDDIVFVIIDGCSLPAARHIEAIDRVNGCERVKLFNRRTNEYSFCRVDDLFVDKDSALKEIFRRKAEAMLPQIKMWYADGGFVNDKRCIGIRSDKDIDFSTIHWMLAADAIDKDGTRIDYVKDLANMSPDDFTVDVRITGFLGVKNFNIRVGNYKVVKNEWDHSNHSYYQRGYLTLSR